GAARARRRPGRRGDPDLRSDRPARGAGGGRRRAGPASQRRPAGGRGGAVRPRLPAAGGDRDRRAGRPRPGARRGGRARAGPPAPGPLRHPGLARRPGGLARGAARPHRAPRRRGAAGRVSGARRRLPGLEGWILVLWAALAVGGMTAAILAARGADLDGVRAGLRATARTSLVLFLAAMAASSLRRLWPVPLTAWLLRNRRYLGVSFAASHAIHLALIASLVPVTPERFTDDPAGLIPGATAYLFVLLLTVTSFDRVADRLGRAWWKRLHL